ncbi:endonuclease/exonuclease/phosphatase family protein [Bythopirellula goksoeyrii]|uniref:endonuclease/exonuclease/phosphatase family protein n=1 Tax=Bythopirellula goksoeyrii TaxID=1400387 RepID=UPI0011CEC776|nr:endonuclease/exonuclease/phosphatase family protein [Bythopirellula goksoeyrii]
MTGSGVGGWALPGLPVLGPSVKEALHKFQGGGNDVLPSGHTSQVDANAAAYQSYGQTAAQPRDSIIIGSFNIQVFGTSKMKKKEVMEVLATVARSFDVLAIQEIRTQDDHFMDQFMQLINAQGAHYTYVIGPRLGRSSSTEQYAFIFNPERIEVRPGSVATMVDTQDLLHREPLIAHFRVRGVPPSAAYSFWLVNIHTDPDEVSTELDVLAEVFQVVQQHGEDDVILLGDLNASETQLRSLGQLPGIRYAISGVPTNTRGNKTYDNLIFDSRTTTEYTGQSGVWNLITSFGLTQEQALQVSDHFPVWAVFSSYEGGNSQMAARPVYSQ